MLLVFPILLESTNSGNALSPCGAPRFLGCRASSGTAARMLDFTPDLAVDTGTCGALDGFVRVPLEAGAALAPARGAGVQ